MTAPPDSPLKYCWYYHGKTYHVYDSRGKVPNCRTVTNQVLNISETQPMHKQPCKKCFHTRAKQKVR